MAIDLDAIFVREIFNYDKETGTLTLNKKRGMGGRFEKGSAVGTLHKCGAAISRKHYLRAYFNGYYVYIHRIIWVLVTGEQPDDIDHIDGNGLNNKWDNLRNVTHSINCKNQKRHATNTSGKGGVTYRKDTDKWRARITVDDKSINLGSFKSKDEAIEARKAAEIKHGFIGE